MNIPSGRKSLGNGIIILSDGNGGWRLEGPLRSFSLDGSEALRCAIALLEFPFSSVASDLGRGFPYLDLVQMGLNHESDYWIGLALSWVSVMDRQDVKIIIDDLNSVALDKRVSQKNRMMARKEIMKLNES